MAHPTRQTLSDAMHAALDADPDRLAPMLAAALPPEELARRSAATRAGTDELPAVRQARRRAAQATIRGSGSNRRKTNGYGVAAGQCRLRSARLHLVDLLADANESVVMMGFAVHDQVGQDLVLVEQGPLLQLTQEVAQIP